jgi:hypothetical protein
MPQHARLKVSGLRADILTQLNTGVDRGGQHISFELVLPKRRQAALLSLNEHFSP